MIPHFLPIRNLRSERWCDFSKGTQPWMAEPRSGWARALSSTSLQKPNPWGLSWNQGTIISKAGLYKRFHTEWTDSSNWSPGIKVNIGYAEHMAWGKGPWILEQAEAGGSNGGPAVPWKKQLFGNLAGSPRLAGAVGMTRDRGLCPSWPESCEMGWLLPEIFSDR